MFCKSCKEEKSLDDFYKSNASKCKNCVKRNVRENRKLNIDYYTAYDKKRTMRPDRVAMHADYQKTDAGKKALRKAHQITKEKYPERIKAASAVSNAVRDGKLFKLPCFICGDKTVEGHHPDYSRPLDVVWLCNKHHREAHALVKDKK